MIINFQLFSRGQIVLQQGIRNNVVKQKARDKGGQTTTGTEYDSRRRSVPQLSPHGVVFEVEETRH